MAGSIQAARRITVGTGGWDAHVIEVRGLKSPRMDIETDEDAGYAGRLQRRQDQPQETGEIFHLGRGGGQIELAIIPPFHGELRRPLS